MLGDGHRRIGRLAAQQRRRVGGGHHDDRARQALGAQVVLEEFPHLAPALADQGEHRHVALGVARQHREQGGLADAGAGEQAEALALAAGGEAVERANAEIEPRSQPRAGGGLRRGNAQRARSVAPSGRAPCPSSGRPSGSSTRPSQASATAKPPPGFAGADGRAARAEAIERVEWHGLRQVGAKPDDLGRTVRPSRASSSRRSPTETWPARPSMSTTRPEMPATRPASRSGGMRLQCGLQHAARSRLRDSFVSLRPHLSQYT